DDELASASRKIAMISSALCLLVFLGIDFLLPGEVSHTKWSEKRGADHSDEARLERFYFDGPSDEDWTPFLNAREPTLVLGSWAVTLER
ncbi:MAG: hypothetical protein AAF735_08310, partial [Myxococcota bacterium]